MLSHFTFQKKLRPFFRIREVKTSERNVKFSADFRLPSITLHLRSMAKTKLRSFIYLNMYFLIKYLNIKSTLFSSSFKRKIIYYILVLLTFIFLIGNITRLIHLFKKKKKKIIIHKTNHDIFTMFFFCL